MYTFPNGKKYIGVTTKTLEERRDCGYQHNQPLRDAMRFYGWRAIKKTIIAEYDTIEDAFAEEERQIKLHKTTDPLNGYNISKGGKNTFAGLKHTEEHKARMSAMYKGKAFTEEHIEHLREAHAQERKAVESYDQHGNKVGSYKSLGDAADAVGGHKTNISRACKSNKEYKGFFWRFMKGGEVR